MNRRLFLKLSMNGVAAASILGTSSLIVGCDVLKQARWFASVVKEIDGSYSVAAVDVLGNIISKVALPQRAHDVLEMPHKPGHVLVFARRPDRFAMEIDLASGQIVKRFSSQADTHFYGHGVLSKNGDYLFTTENRYDFKQGLIVVRNTSTFEVEGRFDSHGIGPHELVFMPDNNTLALANGGIETHPDYPRIKLNLDSMQSNLSYINSQTGALEHQVLPKDPQLSLRHLDVNPQGRVVVGAQYQGKRGKIQALVFSHHMHDKELMPMQASNTQWQQMQQYTASVVCHQNQAYVTCPRGNSLFIFDLVKNKALAQITQKDVAGLVKTGSGIASSNGLGQISLLKGRASAPAYKELNFPSLKFDNHMTSIIAAT
ncbi:DUF1513 domain-containing protein [Glaciecola sp. MH2013]|uniref:DUF1513 domain-containing protein n=1 Tax=Glaciecola sp. MH2013 TaxID=2785524 RepID=UPI00189F7539|nr:DUF1513 domain-containing protein [Glaciecola sp. MH2013]MBF7072196.1 DUF1513 domain-containing protein [Glaciecola sp. MH2013]